MEEKIVIYSDGKSFEIVPKNLAHIDLKSKAIETTKKLLDAENIAHIIYIDDKFDIDGQKEEYKARLIKFKNENSFIVNERFKSIDWSGPTPRFESLISELWENALDKSELLFEVCSHIIDEESANIIPALEIEKCYGSRIKLMTPDQWFSDDFKLIKELEVGKKALCLFDFEFQSGNKLVNGRNGVELAKLLIEDKDCAGRVVCGIFSHKFNEEQEDEFRIKYSKEFMIEKSKFSTISKRRFAFDPQIIGFAEGIKNLLMLPYVEQLKNESLLVLNDSNRRAGERIHEMTPKTFNQIIQKSSLNEGVWEISTLFRLYGILSKEENYNKIADPLVRHKFNDSIKRIREIELNETGYNFSIENQQLTDLRNSELYLNDLVINRLHLPLANGDIFNIKGKEYILLVQPCNLALRAKLENCGKRDYNYDVGMLIPLRLIAKEKLNIVSEEVKIAESSDKFYVAYFPGFLNLSLEILDLCVFDIKGKASIDFSLTLLNNDVIHFPWKKRYEYIYKSLLNYETKILEFNSVKESVTKSINQKRKILQSADSETKKSLAKEILLLQNNLNNTEKRLFEISDLSKFKIDCSKIYDEKSRTIDMSIQRIRHYKSPYSDDLLQKFMLYLSRNAFEHDFTNK